MDVSFYGRCDDLSFKHTRGIRGPPAGRFTPRANHWTRRAIID